MNQFCRFKSTYLTKSISQQSILNLFFSAVTIPSVYTLFNQFFFVQLHSFIFSKFLILPMIICNFYFLLGTQFYRNCISKNINMWRLMQKFLTFNLCIMLRLWRYSLFICEMALRTNFDEPLYVSWTCYFKVQRLIEFQSRVWSK